MSNMGEGVETKDARVCDRAANNSPEFVSGERSKQNMPDCAIGTFCMALI